jgi:hypothetical protein
MKMAIRITLIAATHEAAKEIIQHVRLDPQRGIISCKSETEMLPNGDGSAPRVSPRNGAMRKALRDAALKNDGKINLTQARVAVKHAGFSPGSASACLSQLSRAGVEFERVGHGEYALLETSHA